MTAQTPIKQFVRLNDLFFVEDFAGMRMPIAMCADEGQADFLAYTLERAHGCPVVSWNEVMPAVAASEPDVVHKHGAHGPHGHSALEYAKHQQPIDEEVRLTDLGAGQTYGGLVLTEEGAPGVSLPGDAYPEPMRSLINEGAVGELKESAPDGAPWYAHLDGPCGPSCGHAPDGGNHPEAKEAGGDGLEAVHRPE